MKILKFLEKKFEEKWKKWQPDVRLVTLYSHYRSIINPLTKFIDTVEHKASESNYQVTVIIPQFMPKKGWHNILHNQSGTMIRASIVVSKKRGSHHCTLSFKKIIKYNFLVVLITISNAENHLKKRIGEYTNVVPKIW